MIHVGVGIEKMAKRNTTSSANHPHASDACSHAWPGTSERYGAPSSTRNQAPSPMDAPTSTAKIHRSVTPFPSDGAIAPLP